MSENTKIRAQELSVQLFATSAPAVPTDVQIARALEDIASQLGEIRRGRDRRNKRQTDA